MQEMNDIFLMLIHKLCIETNSEKTSIKVETTEAGTWQIIIKKVI